MACSASWLFLGVFARGADVCPAVVHISAGTCNSHMFAIAALVVKSSASHGVFLRTLFHFPLWGIPGYGVLIVYPLLPLSLPSGRSGLGFTGAILGARLGNLWLSGGLCKPGGFLLPSSTCDAAIKLRVTEQAWAGDARHQWTKTQLRYTKHPQVLNVPWGPNRTMVVNKGFILWHTGHYFLARYSRKSLSRIWFMLAIRRASHVIKPLSQTRQKVLAVWAHSVGYNSLLLKVIAKRLDQSHNRKGRYSSLTAWLLLLFLLLLSISLSLLLLLL